MPYLAPKRRKFQNYPQFIVLLAYNLVTETMSPGKGLDKDQMPLQYQPKRMEVVMCDFTGFVAPEMVKTRPVVILKAHKRNSKLVTVVPLSTTAPTHQEDFHHKLSACPLPDQPSDTEVWAKCDMLYTVSTERLNKYKKRREYFTLKISAEDMEAIRKGVLSALGVV